jgi:predicted pyridoxine 5'-phosphate oxidase superfamily flavin-nucleotide-binding protein
LAPEAQQMSDRLARPSSDVAFTPAVKAVQVRRGSRKSYAEMEARGGFRTLVTPDLAAYLAEARSFYLATASAGGQPYVQHRGGPAGFLRVLDERTLAFADFMGNRQYITTGNLAENPRACIFVMDYPRRRRVKLWGRARVVEDDEVLLARLWPEGYKAKPVQVIVFDIEAWDTNCPQHIPQMFHADDVARTVVELQTRIDALEAEVAALRAGRGSGGAG